MAYVHTEQASRPRHAPMRRGLRGFAGILATGSQGQQQIDPVSVFGDWDTDPLVQYMVAKHPTGIMAGAPIDRFTASVKSSLQELGYQGQPIAAVEKSSMAAAAKYAENQFWALSATSDVSMPQVLMAQQVYQGLIPGAQAVAAMPKPPIKLNLHLSQAEITCIGTKGATWNNATGMCSTSVRSGSTTTAPKASAPAPAPAAKSNTLLYVGGGAVVLGLAAYLLL